MNEDEWDGWTLNPDFGHWLWTEVQNRPRVYWPRDTDAFLELYIDPGIGDIERLIRSAGIAKTSDDDQESVRFDRPDAWMQEMFGRSYTSTNASYVWNHHLSNVDTIRLWGHIYTSIGTRFWFELEEVSPGEAAIDRLRIPVPDSLEADVREWAAEEGMEFLHTKSAIFEQRFVEAGMDIPQPRHLDVHLRSKSLPSSRLQSLVSTALDFGERAARMES